MSERKESAIDALVDEVMGSRADKEAARAPRGAPLTAEEPSTDTVEDTTSDDDVDVDVDETVETGDEEKKKRIKIGFADSAAGLGSKSNGAAAKDEGDLETIVAERDGYLADSQRLAADFANYRKQSDKRVADAAATQSAGLVRDLIAVLDACDAGLVQDPDSAAGPIRNQLLTELTRNGLDLLAPEVDTAFDPEQHEAVMHEPAPEESELDGPVVGEVMRPGYTWKGRVVRPAMVKVIG